jgi:hypothetical protein
MSEGIACCGVSWLGKDFHGKSLFTGAMKDLFDLVYGILTEDERNSFFSVAKQSRSQALKHRVKDEKTFLSLLLDTWQAHKVEMIYRKPYLLPLSVVIEEDSEFQIQEESLGV